MTNIFHWSSESSRNPIFILMLCPTAAFATPSSSFSSWWWCWRGCCRVNRPVIAIVVIPYFAQGLSVAFRSSFGNGLTCPPTSSSSTGSWVDVLLIRCVRGTRVPGIRSGPCIACPKLIILLICSLIAGHLLDGCRFWGCGCCAFLGCGCGCSCHFFLPWTWRRIWWLLRMILVLRLSLNFWIRWLARFSWALGELEWSS